MYLWQLNAQLLKHAYSEFQKMERMIGKIKLERKMLEQQQESMVKSPVFLRRAGRIDE